MHFGGFTPFGGLHPHLTHASYSPDDPEKNGFCLGGNRLPFGGETGV